MYSSDTLLYITFDTPVCTGSILPLQALIHEPAVHCCPGTPSESIVLYQSSLPLYLYSFFSPFFYPPFPHPLPPIFKMCVQRRGGDRQHYKVLLFVVIFGLRGPLRTELASVNRSGQISLIYLVMEPGFPIVSLAPPLSLPLSPLPFTRSLSIFPSLALPAPAGSGPGLIGISAGDCQSFCRQSAFMQGALLSWEPPPPPSPARLSHRGGGGGGGG